MAAPNDGVDITTGSGTTLGAQLVGGKKYQAMVLADSSGHVFGTMPTYTVAAQNSANVAAVRTTHFDLFNAVGSGVILQVRSILIIPTLVAVTGVGRTWEVIRTSSVGTGGTTRSPVSFDSANPALSVNITARSKPTAGAATAFTLLYLNGSSEETLPSASMASVLNQIPTMGPEAQPLVLREGEGLKVDQTTNSAVGSTNVVFTFTVR